MSENDKPAAEPQRERQYQVSTNRDHARHKLRYVESSVMLDDDGECRLCRGAIIATDPAKSSGDDEGC